MDNAAIVGYGVVGQATAKLFGINKHFDIDEEKSNCTLAEVAKCRYIFICLPTPVKNGEYVTGDIQSIIQQINDIRPGAIFIIRSTVWPGFADFIFEQIQPEGIISNPEFLSEDTAEKDIKHPPFVLIGGVNAKYMDEVKGIYLNVTKQASIILTDNITAEASKLALNAFFSTKVVFANQMFDWCQISGANYEKIKEVLTAHPYGFKNHATIYYKGHRGVGGHCLPKDLEAFANYSHIELLQKVKEINDHTKD